MSDYSQAGSIVVCPVCHTVGYDNALVECAVCYGRSLRVNDAIDDEDWKEIELDLRDLNFKEKLDAEQEFSFKETTKLLIPCPLCNTPLLKHLDNYTCSGCDTVWNTDELAEALGDNNFFIEE